MQFHPTMCKATQIDGMHFLFFLKKEVRNAAKAQIPLIRDSPYVPEPGPYFPISTLGTCLVRQNFGGEKFRNLTVYIPNFIPSSLYFQIYVKFLGFILTKTR
jgi:hypothetical protein